MKKTYTKPYVFVEPFELAHSIADSCSITVNASRDSCVLEIGGGADFTVFNNSNCSFSLDEFAALDKMCYHIPVNVNNMFGS